MSKPLAVLKKSGGSAADAEEEEEEGGAEAEGRARHDGGGEVKYNVEGVIRWKFIFKERPRLLISKNKKTKV